MSDNNPTHPVQDPHSGQWYEEPAQAESSTRNMDSEIKSNCGAQEAGRSSIHEVLACTSDAEIGARWRQNSSLEEWFPFTAQKLKTLEAELGNAAVIAVKLGQLSKHWRELSADYRQRAREWATGDPMHEQRSACADMLENCANVLDATVQANAGDERRATGD